MNQITKDQIILNQIQDLYKRYFQHIDDFWGYAKSMGKLSVFVFATYNKNRYEYLTDFVKEYYKMKNQIIFSRNDLIDKVKSEGFKKEKWLNKISIRLKIFNKNKYCKLFDKFEEEFFNRLGVSLLAVENERLAKEQSEKRTQLIQQ